MRGCNVKIYSNQYQRKTKDFMLLDEVFLRGRTYTLNNNADDKMDLKETFTTNSLPNNLEF